MSKEAFGVGGVGSEDGIIPVGNQSIMAKNADAYKRYADQETVGENAGLKMKAGKLESERQQATVVAQGQEVSKETNWLDGYGEHAGVMGQENLFLDPGMNDWSNGYSDYPSMYTGDGFDPAAGMLAITSRFSIALERISTPSAIAEIGTVVYFNQPGWVARNFANKECVSGTHNMPMTFSWGMAVDDDVVGRVRPFMECFNNSGVSYGTVYGNWVNFADIVVECFAKYYAVLTPTGSDVAYVYVGIEVEDMSVGDSIFTDAWQLERGQHPTAWRPSTRPIREISWCPDQVIASGISYVDLALPGGGSYGLVPPPNEDWIIIGLSARVDNPDYGFGSGQTIDIRATRDGSTEYLKATLTNPDTDASVGDNDRSLVITPSTRLVIQGRRTGSFAASPSDIMLTLRYLVLPR